MEKKVIDLGIIPELEVSGVKKISLVEEPAIELDFLYFKKEEFVTPNAGESDDEFLSRCIPYVIGEGKEEDQAAAICYSYLEMGNEDDVDMVNGIIDILLQVKDIENRKRIAMKMIKDFADQGVMYDLTDFIARIGLDIMDFDIDTSGLTPYVDPGVPKKKIGDILTPAQIETILEMASVLGVHEDDVEYVSAFKFAINPKDGPYTPARTITKADGEEVVYKYRSSNVAGNSRQFCSRMMGLSRFYTREEIDALDSFNEEFGPGVGGGQYSIFKYKGGANCQHYWQKYIAQRVGRKLQVTEATPTDNIQQVAETAPRTTQGRGFVKRPQRNLPPLAGHSAFSKLQFNFADEEQKVVVGPAMLPDISIPRKDEETGDIYYVKFSEETIKEIAMKYMKEARTNETNTDHEVNQAGAYIFESWIVEDPKTDKANTVYGYDVPKGTWMVKMKVEDKETWKRIKNGELKGFSVEGSFSDMEEIEYRRKYEKIRNILK